MEQQPSMVQEVNKIISNALLIKRSIQLPSIGTLYVENMPAQLTKEGKSILPSKNVVHFTQQLLGETLITEITQRGKCSEEVATTIYNRWKEQVDKSGDITIEGVGVIQSNGGFTCDQKLNARLNPAKPRSIAIKRRRRDTWIWIVASIASAMIVGFLVFQYSNSWISNNDTPTKLLIAQNSELEEVRVREIEQQAKIDSTEVKVTETTETPQVTEVKKLEQDTTPTPIKVAQATNNATYRVVYGVFSVDSSIKRAKKEIAKYNSSLSCQIYPYGKSTMVSVFESDNIDDCKAFIASNKALSDELWISKRK